MSLSHIVSFSLKFVFAVFALTLPLHAQSVQVYSEFQRIDPLGHVVQPDSGYPPREIISPAAIRNGFTSFHVAVTAPPGSNYFLFVGVNPPGIITTRLYKEVFQLTHFGWIPDALQEIKGVGFGVVPDAQAAIPGQTTRDYLLDVWVPPDAQPGRRVRIELQLKVGGWIVYPLEVRVQNARVPQTEPGAPHLVPPVDAAADAAIAAPLATYFVRDFHPALTIPATVRDIIRRNAEQDLALAAADKHPELWLAIAAHMVPGWLDPGPEWYLRFRDLLYRRAQS